PRRSPRSRGRPARTPPASDRGPRAGGPADPLRHPAPQPRPRMTGPRCPTSATSRASQAPQGPASYPLLESGRPMDWRRPLEAALDAAVAAGEILRRDFHHAGGARGAGDKAEADVEAERLIRARLGEAFPGWGYLGEETGRAPGEPGRPIWLVDPNDGTRDFLAGRRGSAVSIGLLAER